MGRWRARRATRCTSTSTIGRVSNTERAADGALIRLANLKFDKGGTLGERFDRLVATHLTHHVLEELHLVTDEFSEQMETKLMRAVLAKHQPKLEGVFGVYGAADVSLAARAASATMNIKEMGALCEEAGMYDTSFGIRELVAAFVKVNIDDELYEQSEEGNTSSELVYDEFEEVVARIFYTKVWLRTPAAERPDLLETGFDAWLADEFVPRALDAVKRRKKGQAAKKM